jgi:hypothetical protein
VATPRAVRIPRSTAGVDRPREVPAEATSIVARSAVERRVNGAGTRRAFRFASLYLGALIVLYLAFVLLDRFGPNGGGPAVNVGLEYFTAIAALLAVGGVVVALSPAPRAVDISPTSVVVVEWWGRRRRFAPLGELRVEVVRRYPRTFLSPDPVEGVEISDRRGPRRTYQLAEGLLPEQRFERPAREI